MTLREVQVAASRRLAEVPELRESASRDSDVLVMFALGVGRAELFARPERVLDDAEAALRNANLKFTRRFHYVEERAREDGIPLPDAGLERLDAYWNEIRQKDK